MDRGLSFVMIAALVFSLGCGGGSGAGQPGPMDTEAPKISSITGVSDGLIVREPVEIGAIATDNNSVASFALKINDATVASVPLSTLSYTWDISMLAPGEFVLEFAAMDAAGNTGTRTLRVTAVPVAQAEEIAEENTQPAGPQDGYTLPTQPPESIDPADTEMPKLLLLGFADGDTVYGVVKLQALAIDDTGINAFTLLIGDEQVAISTNYMLEYEWHTEFYADGAYPLTYIVRDNGGKTGQLEIGLTVDNATEKEPPSLDLTGFDDFYVSYTQHLHVLAEDASGVESVSLRIKPYEGWAGIPAEVYADEVLVQVDGPELAYDWDTMALNSRHYSWIAVVTATDNNGNKVEVWHHFNIIYDISAYGWVTMTNGLPFPNALVCVVPQDFSGPLAQLPDGSLDHCYTDDDGEYLLQDAPIDAQHMIVIFGDRSFGFDYFFPDYYLEAGGPHIVPHELNVFPALNPAAKSTNLLAKVSGDYDFVQSCLWDSLDARFALDGTQQEHIDGNDYFIADAIPSLMELLGDPAMLYKYHTLLVNSGIHYEAELAESPAALDNLRGWIEDGGRLFCTGHSYDVIELLYPRMLSFTPAAEGNGLSDEPEPLDCGQRGPDGELEKLRSCILRDPGAGWVACREIGYGMESSFFESMMYELDDGDYVELSDALEIDMDGFADGWPVITQIRPEVVVWLSLKELPELGLSGEVPVFVSFRAGLGKVFLSACSSYQQQPAADTFYNELVFEALFNTGFKYHLYPHAFDED